jgi:hypothetical protein
MTADIHLKASTITKARILNSTQSMVLDRPYSSLLASPDNPPKPRFTRTDKSYLRLPEIFLVCDFANGLGQSLQEALMQLLPRAGAGMIIRKTPLIGIEETVLELAEYLLSFILLSPFAASISKPLARSVGIPHYELLGMPAYQIHEKLGQQIEVGTLNKTKVKLDKELIQRISVGKLGLFAMLAAYCFAMEFVSSSLKVISMNGLFHTCNFYTISGLTQGNHEESLEGEEALAKAWSNLKKVFLFLPVAVGGLFGLTALISKSSGVRNSRSVASLARIFDMSAKFGLPKTLLAVSVLTAGFFAYPSVARNAAEKLEIKHRVIEFAAPTVLFFKQVVGNILAWLAGQAMGLGNVLSPVNSYFAEVKTGKRNIFDLGLVDLEHDKEQGFSGKITDLPKLSGKAPEVIEKQLKTIHFMAHRAPYWIALLAGIGVNWLNYLNTSRMHSEENGKEESTSARQSALLQLSPA